MDKVQSMAGDFLRRILADKREEVRERKAQVPLEILRERAALADPVRPFLSVFRGGGLQVIAEVKRRSPSKGDFDGGLDAAALAALYAKGGAAAISVLTDGPFFGGSLADLQTVRDVTTLPILRKDFIIDRYQLYEARAAGADLVLLIVKALSVDSLKALLDETQQLGMCALVEVNIEAEAHLAVEVQASLVGINNRDLNTFEVDMGTTAALRPILPQETVVASLSGIAKVEDALEMRRGGADAVLIGEALVRSSEPVALLAALRGIA